MSAPHYHGHRARIKERCARQGVDSWSEYEFLEYVLTFALPRRDTKGIAKTLLARFRTFSGVVDAGPAALRSVPGIGPHAAALIGLCRHIAARYAASAAAKRDVLSSPATAIAYLSSRIKASPQEEFHALFLDTGNRLIAAELLHTGTVNRSAVYPRTIAQRALAHNATGLIIAHNHPGGSLTPSPEDLHATASVARALAAIDVRLLDHIIVTGEGHYSFREHGSL